MKQRTTGVFITLLLTAFLSCKKEEPPISDTTDSASRTVEVVLRFSGAAHLADGMNPPVIIVPNFKKERDHPHDPMIVAIPDFVAPGGLPSTRNRIDKDDGDRVLLTVMHGDIPAGFEIDLVNSGVTNPGTLQMDVGDTSNDVCPTPSEGSTTPAESLHWLPRLWKVSKSSQPFALKESFTMKDPDPEVVITRLEVKGGKLEAELAGYEKRKFRFRIGDQDAPDDVVQTVSTSLNYIFKVDLPASDPVFTLKGRRFGTDGSREEHFVVLGKFKPLTGRDRIEIDIVNVPREEFFNVRIRQTIPHFELHYRIVEGEPAQAVPEFDVICANGDRPFAECGPTH